MNKNAIVPKAKYIAISQVYSRPKTKIKQLEKIIPKDANSDI